MSNELLPKSDYIARKSSVRIGRRRMRLPVGAKSALHTAGAIGGTPGSPQPPAGRGKNYFVKSGLGA